MEGPGPGGSTVTGRDREAGRDRSRASLRIRAAVRRGGMVLLLAVTLAGCAASTLGSGVGDRWLDQAPYYAGSEMAAPGGVLVLPVSWQTGEDHPAELFVEEDAYGAGAQLMAAMDDYLDALAAERGWTRLEDPTGSRPGLGLPDVTLSCETDVVGDCVVEEDEMGNPVWDERLYLSVTRGNDAWAAWAREVLAQHGAGTLLLVTLEPSQYWPRQVNWRGSKVVELGTDRVQPLPWLTALDRPVSVIQLTGVAVGPDGRARRMGGEGLLAKRTPFLLSSFGLQALLDEDDVATLLRERIGDEPGAPLVWQAALDALVEQLTP